MWKYVIGTVVVGSTVCYCISRYFAGCICDCPTGLNGLVVVVTGANSGIGKSLSLSLARRGATVVLACRNLEAAELTRRYILQQCRHRCYKPIARELDLTSFASIIKFVENLKQDVREVYALVNNAGIFYHRQCLTGDGFDITMQTNYLGAVVLTQLLLPHIRKCDHGRIINVSSEAHRNVNVHDLFAITKDQEMPASLHVIYGVTKLALNLYTRALSKRLSNTNILVNAVDPGNVETNIFRHFPPLSNPWLYALQWPIRVLVTKSPWEGGHAVLHAVLTVNRSTGQYYRDCKLALPSPLSLNDKVAEEYYNLTMNLLREVLGTESDC